MPVRPSVLSNAHVSLCILQGTLRVSTRGEFYEPPPLECGILGVVADYPPRNEIRLGGFIPVTVGRVKKCTC